MNYEHIKPRTFELFCGPMKSGKTKEILLKYDILSHIKGCNILFIKPKIDTRTKSIITRYNNKSIPCHNIDEKNPKEILTYVTKECNVIIIDEIQFFSKKIIKIIEKLLKKDIYIIAAGLDSDYRGKGFGPVPELMVLASKVHKLSGICEYPNCSSSSTRSQRILLNTKENNDNNSIKIENKECRYETRCLKHHIP
jgi:thymidine kinase